MAAGLWSSQRLSHSLGRECAVFARVASTLRRMVAQIRHKFWGGVEVVDAATGRVLAEVETDEQAGALIAGMQAEQEQKSEPGLLDILFGSDRS